MVNVKRRKVLTAAILSGVAAGMVGASFAAVPLYRVFCQATGYGGTPRTQNVKVPHRLGDREMTVQFDANVSPGLPWGFRPVQQSVTVRPGQEVMVYFQAVNHGDKPITGTASFNVSPDTVGKYFNKTQCFCFTEQTLQPGEDATMPVVFFVDPALLDDPETADVTRITLSYTFFRRDDQQPGGVGATLGRRGGAS
jgi:cytochrome c oxidase assembly protein subunit 11